MASRRDRVESPYDSEHLSSGPSRRDIGLPFQQVTHVRSKPTSINSTYATPTVQGIPLVPISALPGRLRTMFPFPTFNAVQSKCFDRVFKSNDNFVLASPTGSGKTAILELAICRAISTNTTGQYKVVYQAPTKALCSERQRDWDKKFTQIGLKCAELTGDSDVSDLRNVQSANIIITTPEKWDSMTRKWKDHEKLMKLIKLFLIDEVHILKEDRGAVLEVIVSRMKSIGTDVRFVALSATVPNFHDVASWLGKSSTEPHIPAPKEKFGEEFRPVKLTRYVCGYVCHSNNDFAFEKQLDTRLPEVITKYSERKPMMVFCATRNSTVNTAKLIANWWASKSGHDRLWNPPAQAPRLQNKDLRELTATGVAFHHAGLDLDDRMEVERGFLQGDINVICCTSTLAVGVNLPCHLVIIKNTMSWTQDGLQEYSDLEMMQMLGRAGRPQFDDSAIAVIMTRQTKVRRYETLVTGEEVLESKLHLNLIDHMNAEIVLGTIRDLDSSRKWLKGTFLYVRLQQNPVYYKLDGSWSGQDVQEQVDDICFRDIALLREHNLATGEQHFRCTEYGHAMARYYVHFETMKLFVGLQPRSTLSEIVTKAPEGVNIQVKADIGFINEKPPDKFAHKLIYVCLLAETSDGRKVHFARIKSVSAFARKKSIASDDFGDTDIDDDTLAQAMGGDLDFEHIDNFANPTDAIKRKNTTKNQPAKVQGQARDPQNATENDGSAVPVQISNGRWMCSHKCKDKEACKHYCCKHGMDKPPKKAAPKRLSADESQDLQLFKSPVQPKPKTQSKLQLHASKRKMDTVIEELDLTQHGKKQKSEYAINGPRDYRGLQNLHKGVQKKDMPSSLHSVMHKKPAYCYGEGGEHQLSFLNQPTTTYHMTSSEYGGLELDETAPEIHKQPLCLKNPPSMHFSDQAPVVSRGSDAFGDDDSIFSEAIVGLADSQDLQGAYAINMSKEQDYGNSAVDVTEEAADAHFPVEIDLTALEDDSLDPPKHMKASAAHIIQAAVSTIKTPVFNSTSSSVQHTKGAKSTLPDRQQPNVRQGKVTTQIAEPGAGGELLADDTIDDLFNLLDNPPIAEVQGLAHHDQTSAKDQAPGQSVQVEAEKEPEQIPEAFQGLQPWLFQQFGDIVELVDE
ncbi:ATP-dependent DNA helicase MER3 [Ascochyta clinopodiicola]|nr:ATP-dependent DNA helicase MER3 [Ascochyta clinopodiicola]